jgi:MFS family permease
VSDDRIGRYQIGIFTLCGACLIMDGFDVQAIGYVAPAIIQDWKMPAADMGPVFSAGLLGLFLGSLLFSMLSATGSVAGRLSSAPRWPSPSSHSSPRASPRSPS